MQELVEKEAMLNKREQDLLILQEKLASKEHVRAFSPILSTICNHVHMFLLFLKNVLVFYLFELLIILTG